MADEFTPQKNYYPLGSDVVSSASTAEKPGTNTPATAPALSNVIPTGGGTILNGGTIQSPNYAYNASGWKIDSNGNVEFGAGFFRGDITGASGTFAGTITASSGTIGGWNITSTALRSGASDAASNVLIDSANTLLRLGPTSGNYITLDGANLRIRSSNYSAGVAGFTIEPTIIEAENIVARGTLRGVTFKYDVVSAVGGQLLVSNSDALASDMTALDAGTMTVRGDTTFAVNDILLIRAVATGIQEEYFRVTNAGSAPTYTVTRDLAAAYASNSNPTWKAGTTVVKLGVSDGAASYSGGWLRLLGEGTNSPFYSVFSRTGVAYNSYSERVRLGNLNGIGGKVADCYGWFVGDYSTGQYGMYDDTSGVLIVNGSRFAGNVFYGSGSDGDVTISSNTTLTRNMYYNNLTINNTFTLNPGGYQIFVKGTLTTVGTGKIARNGNTGGTGGDASPTVGGTAGAAAAALAAGTVAGSIASVTGGAGANSGAGPVGGNGSTGTNITESTGVNGVAGAAGGVGPNAAGSGGAAGTITAAVSGTQNIAEAIVLRNSLSASFNQINSSAASGGGGGGGSSSTGAGGGGGGSGGPGPVVAIYAKTIINAGTISCNGGAGGAGGNGNTRGGGGGGGAGGSGGVLLLVYRELTNTGTISVSGGVGGAGGLLAGASTADGSIGTTGATGTLIQLQE